MTKLSKCMKQRVHEVVEQLSDEELAHVWSVMSDFYYDAYTLRAIQSAKRSLTPGDSFTRDEALQFLSHL